MKIILGMLFFLSSCVIRPSPIIVEIDRPQANHQENAPTHTPQTSSPAPVSPTVQAVQNRVVEIDLFYPEATPIPTSTPKLTPSPVAIVVPLEPPPPEPTPSPISTPVPIPLPTAAPSLEPQAQTYVINANFIPEHDPYGDVPVGHNKNAVLLHEQLMFNYVPGQKLLLYGSEVNAPHYFSGIPVCCIGTSGTLDIWINGQLTLSFGIRNSQNQDQVLPDGYDLTSRALQFLRTGQNNFEVRMSHHTSRPAWASALSLHIETE